MSVANQLTHIAHARLTNPEFFTALEGGTNGLIPPPQRTIGWVWCNWIEANCRLGEGDLYGRPPRLTGVQRALIWKLGEIEEDIDPEEPDAEREPGVFDWRLRFQLAVVSFSKGGGKTPLGGWFGSLDLAGPRVPVGWTDHPVYGRMPVAGPRSSPDVINMASSYEQADLILDEIRATFEKGPQQLVRMARTQKGLVELTGGQRGKARRIPATPKKADGSKATTLLVDEMHEFEGDRQERAFTVASGGTAKRRNGLTLIMSTAGFDMDTAFGRLVARGLRGDFDHHELFVYLYAGEQDLDSSNPEHIAEGIRQSNPLARCGVANVHSLVAKFRGMPLSQAKRYYWNIWTASEEAWLPEGAWDACRDRSNRWINDDTLPTWIGVDMAKTRDSAAVITLQRRRDGKLQARAKIWNTGGRLIPQNDVDAYVLEQAMRHGKHLEWIAGDPAWWASLPELEQTPFPVGQMENGCLPIFRMPQQGRNMVMAYTQAYRAIVDQVLIHQGAPDFSDQIASAVPASTDRGWVLKKMKFNRPIDCCPALASSIFASTLPRERVPALPRPGIF